MCQEPAGHTFVQFYFLKKNHFSEPRINARGCLTTLFGSMKNGIHYHWVIFFPTMNCNIGLYSIK